MAGNSYLIYEKRGSWIESWDPRAKILGFALFGLSILLNHSFMLKTAELLVLILFWRIAKLSWKALLWTGASLSIFFASTMIYRSIVAADESERTLIVAGLRLSSAGIESGVLMCEQIAGIVLLLSLLVRTTSPVVLAEGLELLLQPLKRWKLPVHEAVMMFSIALRFLPLVLEEFDTVRKAQTARGGGFHRKGVLARFKGVMPMLLPLFVLSIQRAKDLAVAMESRCYAGDQGRTPIRIYRMRAADYAVLVIALLHLPLYWAFAQPL